MFHDVRSKHLASCVHIDAIVLRMLRVGRLAWQVGRVLGPRVSCLVMKQLRVPHIIICRLGSLACKLVHRHLVVKRLLNLLSLSLSHVSKIVETLFALSLTLLVAESLFSRSFSADWFATSIFGFCSFNTLLL